MQDPNAAPTDIHRFMRELHSDAIAAARSWLVSTGQNRNAAEDVVRDLQRYMLSAELGIRPRWQRYSPASGPYKPWYLNHVRLFVESRLKKRKAA